ncbi:hypothetical protein AWB91_09655 [Mycobacterium paraense]|uniref:Carbon monoxide dehydrogenase n=1 Tax=Mycobacterium paraense TaxID=767916 RepID=A0ABX3VR40_9MYCO|nr:SRPBCC family protein [Mycobacterium paraense]ORW32746.1 hypothetical protein AWB91_09655 [Mycobacterium paraense]ORW44972.1 hypothetical protein AWB88_04730 [Mycobacterium paraense]
MQLKNEFLIDTGIDHAWNLLTDIDLIAPCLPGIVMEGRDGENYLATVKIKVGPIRAHFRGSARFTFKDAAAYGATVSAAGKDPRGTASAAAEIRFRLEPAKSHGTRVLIDTDLDISGRIAQFGRGAIADVSDRLLGQFVENLTTQLLAQGGSGINRAPALDAASDLSGAQAGRSSVGPAATNGHAERLVTDLDIFSLILPRVKQRYGQAMLGALGGFVLSWIVFGRKERR